MALSKLRIHTVLTSRHLQKPLKNYFPMIFLVLIHSWFEGKKFKTFKALFCR